MPGWSPFGVLDHQNGHSGHKMEPQGLQNDAKMGVWGFSFPNFPEIDETLILTTLQCFNLIIGVLGAQEFKQIL